MFPELCKLMELKLMLWLVGGGLSAKWLSTALEDQNIKHKIITTLNPVRTNVTVVEESGLVTKINEPGSAVSPETMHFLKKTIGKIVA